MFLNLPGGSNNWYNGYHQWVTSGTLQSFHSPIFPNVIPEKLLILFDLKPIPKKRMPLRIMKRKKWKK